MHSTYVINGKHVDYMFHTESVRNVVLVTHLGPVFTKGLSQGLGLKLRLLSQVYGLKTAKTFVVGLMVFIKNLRLFLGLAKGSILRLVGSGLKFCKEDLNMAAINFSPLQNLKWL